MYIHFAHLVRCNFGGGGQPDSDMKVDVVEIGIGKIGISDFFNLKLPILANFGKIGNKFFFNFLFFTQYPLHLSE